MRVRSLVVLALAVAFEGALAQPAHRHAHLHKRSLKEVVEKRGDEQFSNPDMYKDVDFDKELECFDWTTVFGEGAKKTMKKCDKTKGDKKEEEKKSDSSSKDVVVAQKYAAPSPSEDAPKSTTSKSGAEDDSQSKDDTSSGDDSSNTSDCSDLSDLHVEGNSKSKRATVAQDNYVGNTGAGNYGSNMIPEKNCKSSGKYSLTFVNTGKDSDFLIWNKIGASGKMDGMMSKGKEFHLKKGQKATFTFQSNTQMGFSKAVGRDNLRGGVPNSNVGEANFDDQSEDGDGSLYNVSMVTYNEILHPLVAGQTPGNPVLVPMKLSAKGFEDSTNAKCVYTKNSQNAPVNPWKEGQGCKTWQPGSADFHVTATFS